MDEDETDVAVDNLNQLIQVKIRVLILCVTKASTDHSVLAHEHGGGATKLDTHLLHLLRSDEIGMNDQDVGVGLDVVDELVKVDLLLLEDLQNKHKTNQKNLRTS